jgi:hypothetical protein
MSEYTKSLGSLNIEQYLQDFIDTYLTLTFEEQRKIEELQNSEIAKIKLARLEEKLRKQRKRELKALGLKTCKVCKKDLPISDFYPEMAMCKKCHNKIRALRQKKRFCKECLQIKPVSEFTGREYICKQCKEKW